MIKLKQTLFFILLFYCKLNGIPHLYFLRFVIAFAPESYSFLYANHFSRLVINRTSLATGNGGCIFLTSIEIWWVVAPLGQIIFSPCKWVEDFTNAEAKSAPSQNLEVMFFLMFVNCTDFLYHFRQTGSPTTVVFQVRISSLTRLYRHF
jgi:hypothetical protein